MFFPVNSPTVLLIGPPLDQMGGISTVVRQILSLDFGGTQRVAFFPTTASTDMTESVWSRMVRHLRHLAALRKTLLESGAGIVHIHTCSGFSFYRSLLDFMVAKLLGRCVLLHIHGAYFDAFYKQGGGVQRCFIRCGLTLADRVIALSSGWRRTLAKMVPKARIEVIENAVSTSILPDRRKTDQTCRILMLARMDKWKGVDDLLEACSLLLTAPRTLGDRDLDPKMRDSTSAPAIRTAVAPSEPRRWEVILAGPSGTADQPETLHTKIARRGLVRHVRYVGPVEGAAKAKLLESCDVFVQPSHHEGMPLAMLEAMAYGLPIVATSVGAVPEVVSHGQTGLLIPPHKPAELAELLAVLIANQRLREFLGNSARQLAATRFSVLRLRDDLQSIYARQSRSKKRCGNQDARLPARRDHANVSFLVTPTA